MEITAQIAALEDEVKILKGEIKSILGEIRTAVLAQDNPFSGQGGLRVFQPIERSERLDERPAAAEEPPLGPSLAPATEPGPAPTPASQMDDALPQVRPSELAAPPPMAWADPKDAPLPAVPEPAPSPTWSVSTIASLVAWVDETSRLGSTHLHIILDLARFAGLLPSEAEEALLKVIKLASSRKDSATVSVNDTLVALRQLEAIFQGADADEVSIVRRRRNAGRSR